MTVIALVASLASAHPQAGGVDVRSDTGARDAPESLGDKPAPIENGEQATADRYPMAQAMLHQFDVVTSGENTVETIGLRCSSTRIAPDVIITAAHCVRTNGWYGEFQVENIQLWFLGDANIKPYEYYGEEDHIWLPERAVRSTQWTFPDEYPDGTDSIGPQNNYDVALIFLDTADVYAPMGVVVGPDEVQLEVGMELLQVGWGMTVPDDLDSSGIKHWGTFHVTRLLEKEFVAGDVNQGDSLGCNGDSGGPVFALMPDQSLRIVGVDSHKHNSDRHCSEVAFTTISDHLDWIDAAMREACSDGTRVWCEVPGILPASWEPPPLPDTGEGEAATSCACQGAPGGWGLVSLLAVLAVRRRRS